MTDLLRRYFVANPAPILKIRRAPGCGGKLVRTRCGNADGFFLWGYHVGWRRPWSEVWGYDPQQRRWVPAYSLAKAEA